ADVLTMFTLALPICGLYAIAVGVRFLHDRRADNRAARLLADHELPGRPSGGPAGAGSSASASTPRPPRAVGPGPEPASRTSCAATGTTSSTSRAPTPRRPSATPARP